MTVTPCKANDLKVGDLMMAIVGHRSVVREVTKVMPAALLEIAKPSLYDRIWEKILCCSSNPPYDDSCWAIWTKYPNEELYEREPFIVDKKDTILKIEKV